MITEKQADLICTIGREISGIRQRTGKPASAIYLGSRLMCEFKTLPPGTSGVTIRLFEPSTMLGVPVFEVLGDLDHLKVAA